VHEKQFNCKTGFGLNNVMCHIVAGVVSMEPERVQLADGEAVLTRTYPTMALDIECGKNTDFNYGPWADRQR